MRRTGRVSAGAVLTLTAALLLQACGDAPTPSSPRQLKASYSVADVPVSLTPQFPRTPSRATMAAVPGPGQVELVSNGGFELNGGPNSQVFADWTNFNQPGGDQNGFRAQSGTLSPTPGGVFPVPAPPEGLFTAMSTQGGPGSHIIYQDITLPPHGNGKLSFQLFIGNRAGAFFSPPTLAFNTGPNQQFRMDIVDPAAPIQDVGAGVLMNVYQTQPGDQLVMSGYITVTADLSAFNGQTVRLRFAETDNQLFFNAGVDDVSVIAQVDPVDKDECKKDGWIAFGFRNQGQCVRFVETGKDSRTETEFNMADLPEGVTPTSLTTLVTTAAVPGPGQIQAVTNGGFEVNGGPNTEIMAGWTTFDQPGWDQIGFRVQTGTTTPVPGGVFTVPPPPEGLFAAMSNQSGPGSHIIYQDISLPTNGNGQLSFRLFIGNRNGIFFTPPTLDAAAFPNQQFRMDVMSPLAPIQDVGAGVLLNVYQTKVGDPPVSDGYLTVTADLSAFNGQTVRLRFAVVETNFFFNAGVDDVSVIAQVDPVNKDECKNDGWKAFGFKNQGQCVRFVETGKDSRIGQ